MPSYEYVCLKCNKRFTLDMTISEYEKQNSISCPHCNSQNVKRVYSSFTAVTSKKS